MLLEGHVASGTVADAGDCCYSPDILEEELHVVHTRVVGDANVAVGVDGDRRYPFCGQWLQHRVFEWDCILNTLLLLVLQI